AGERTRLACWRSARPRDRELLCSTKERCELHRSIFVSARAPKQAREGARAPQRKGRPPATADPYQLLGVVQNPSAVLAAHDFLPRSCAHRGGGGHFHVTTGADFVFERDDNGVPLARKKTLETTQQIFVDLAGELSAFLRQVFQPRLQRF